MKLAFLVNDRNDLTEAMTTTMLIRSAQRRGHAVYVASGVELGIDRERRVQVKAVKLSSGPGLTLSEAVETVAERTPERLSLDECDAVVVRTNPARDVEHARAHDLMIRLLEKVEAKGTLVLNSPAGLRRADTKLYLTEFPPEVVPRCIVSCDRDDIVAFIAEQPGQTVIKPLEGTRGRGVFLLDRQVPYTINSVVELLLEEGPIMAQPFVESPDPGDLRVLVLDGEVLEVNGAMAAIRRIPASSDFRSNIHAGGTATVGRVPAGLLAAIRAIGPKLAADGIFLAGLDFVGSRIIEVNVFSPGGLRDAERITQQDFAGAIIDRVAARVHARTQAA